MSPLSPSPEYTEIVPSGLNISQLITEKYCKDSDTLSLT